MNTKKVKKKPLSNKKSPWIRILFKFFLFPVIIVGLLFIVLYIDYIQEKRATEDLEPIFPSLAASGET